MHLFGSHTHEKKPSEPTPTRILHIEKKLGFLNESFIITDNDRSTPLYTMIKYDEDNTVQVFRPSSSTDPSIGQGDHISDIHFDQHARKSTLNFSNKCLEMIPLSDTSSHNFNFKTSLWGDMRWIGSGLFSVKAECFLDVAGVAEKWVATLEHQQIKLPHLESDRELVDELVISAFAMLQQEKYGYLHS